jgi:SAM-dependent methyltransferase
VEIRPPLDVPTDEPLFATKALRKLLAALTARESPSVIDLGPVVGSNVSFFGEQIGCKIFIEDLYGELERYVRAGKLEEFPAHLSRRFPQADGTVDGIICWDLIDYLDRASAQALADQLTRVLRPEGALLGFFGNAPPREAAYTKFVIADEMNLKHRTYPAARGRQTVLPNRDIIRLFSGLRVSDSFLMKNNIREILFRKPSYETR